MTKQSEKPERLRIRLGNKATMQELRTILTYEACVRGVFMGQAVCELVEEGADIDSYPSEVQAKLAEFAAESASNAMRKSLEMGE